MRLELYAEFSAGVIQSASLTAGIEYKNNEWGTIQTFEKNFEYQKIYALFTDFISISFSWPLKLIVFRITCNLMCYSTKLEFPIQVS